MTEKISVNGATLSGAMRHDVAALLAEAFHEDEAMISLLGERRWHKNAYRYFELQLDHSDHIVIEEQSGVLCGALLARSPDAVISPKVIWQFLRMIWLLGLEYPHSQRIAQAISNALPAPPYWYINQIAVKPDMQKRGMGAQLLSQLMKFVGDEVVYVDCETELDYFYQSQGFTTVETFPAFNLQLMTNHC